jgi:hypothetical protein
LKENRPASQPSARFSASSSSKRIITTDLAFAPTIAAWDLGGGEQAVLNWGFHHRDHEAILDDRAARKCARILGID